ncbi:hypothetical protein DY000_02025357 [Brassica cretica]|uniref:Uncharacterized protein n=1 Tax=Brassica cretica TaxID=69181 RepID=A0ABQ7E896_BRACR|nr:hypothetical protein DY000_02025357 [Brassica cretica]
MDERADAGRWTRVSLPGRPHQKLDEELTWGWTTRVATDDFYPSCGFYFGDFRHLFRVF